MSTPTSTAVGQRSRLAGVADLQVLTDLFRRSLTEALVAQACVRVATVDDDLAAFIVVVPMDYANAEIDELVVGPGPERDGLRELLLQDAETVWRAQGVDRFEVNATSRDASFYSAVGFVTDRVVRTRGGDAIRMHKDLPG